MAIDPPATVRIALRRKLRRERCERSRWRVLEREQRDARSRGLGGDRKSHVIDACKDCILAVLEDQPDVTIEELRRTLAAQGHVFGYGSIRRFFARHAITRKKRPRTPPSRKGQTS